MSKKKNIKGVLDNLLYTEDFDGLTSKLSKWRTNPHIILMDSKKAKGRILGFVKGLRLSSQIAYLVRKILSTDPVDVNWGHLVHNGSSCSPECDIIIHEPGFIQEWNGNGKPIMDFKFVECNKAIAIVSCKSYLRSIDKDYCKTMKKYGMKKIFLFAECCSEKSVQRLKKQAKEAGYSGLYYLFTLGKDSFVKKYESVHLQFVEDMKNLLKTSR